VVSFLLTVWGLFFATRQASCGEEYFVALPNRSIQLGQIRPGSKLVFQYGCQTKGFRGTIARDVGMRHAVSFEVDAESHAFYLEDEALQRAKVLLSRHCRCKPLAYNHLEGTVEGHQTKFGQWEITIDLTAVDANGKEVMKLNSTGVYKLP
jgi:hypothetical protein